MNPPALKEASKEPTVNIDYKFISGGFNYEYITDRYGYCKTCFSFFCVDYAGNIDLRKRVLRLNQ